MASPASIRIARRLQRLSVSDYLRLGVVSCLAVAVALVAMAHATSPASDSARTLIGKPAPTFTLPAAQHNSRLAQPVTFAGGAGHPTLLVFFDTLCTHCVAGVQAAQEAAQSTHARVIFVDAPGENAEITGQYMARLRLDAPVLLDSGARVASRYAVGYYPTLALVDARGVERAVWVGSPTVADLRDAIQRTA